MKRKKLAILAISPMILIILSMYGFMAYTSPLAFLCAMLFIIAGTSCVWGVAELTKVK